MDPKVFFVMTRRWTENEFHLTELRWPDQIVLTLWVQWTVAVGERHLILVQNLDVRSDQLMKVLTLYHLNYEIQVELRDVRFRIDLVDLDSRDLLLNLLE